MCQTWSGRRGPRPRVASRWNGASRRSSTRRDRPAVAPVGVDVTLGRASGALAVALEQRAQRPAPRAAGRARARRTASGERRARRRRPTGGVLAAEQLLRLRRPGHQLAVEADPVGLELLPEAGGVERRAHAVEQLRLERRVVEEAPAGAGVARCRSPPSATPKRSRAASSSRQTITTAREPMCFSSQTTRGDALAAVVGERLAPDARGSPARCAGLATATSSAAGRSATAGRRRSGSSPRARRPRSPRGS